MGLTIRPLTEADIPAIVATFQGKPTELYRQYLAEQGTGARVTLVAYLSETFVGYLNVVWHPDYPGFAAQNIPEIQDFNVAAAYRRQGIGSQLLEAAEHLAGEQAEVVGISVGLDADYGAAQRLYVKRGYIPDGRGITYDNRPLRWGDTTRVDDSLNLHFTRRLFIVREPG
jgi:ribosomal protein S18 acetylase RimI-like enzyme